MAATVGCRVTGIDHSQKLIDMAKENRKSSGLGDRITLICTLAEQYEARDENVFFFFNPFSGKVFESVLRRLKERDVGKLILYYPSDEYMTWLNLMPEALSLPERAKALPKRRMEDFLNGIVPKRLGQALVKAAGIDMARPAGALTRAELERLHNLLTGWTIPVTGTQGFDQAQVTAGGASLKDFDARAMRSLRCPGLFAAGEVLDVDGDCGGFNLQWAWSSALLAADAMDGALSNSTR